MKVKIFAFSSTKQLEEAANEFLQTNPSVIDIKYAASAEFSEIMIVYDDETKAAE